MGKKTDLKDSCAYCGTVNCINLFRHNKRDIESVGGELYLYKHLNHSWIINENLEKHVCSNGRLLECACFIIETAREELPQEYLTNICIEIVRDMKASFYLAMSGHYRQAVLVQRCVFENFLYGLYFHTEHYHFSRSDEDRKQVQDNFKSWIDGGFQKPDTYLRDIIERCGLISKSENREWGILFNRLSKFVHTLLHTPTGKSIKYGNIKLSGCEAEVQFDKNSLIEWSGYYQSLMFLVLCKFLMLFPFVKKEEAGKLALGYIRTEFRDIQGQLNNPYLEKLLKMRGGKSKPK